MEDDDEGGDGKKNKDGKPKDEGVLEKWDKEETDEKENESLKKVKDG